MEENKRRDRSDRFVANADDFEIIRKVQKPVKKSAGKAVQGDKKPGKSAK